MLCTMKNYLLWLLAVPLMSPLLSIASAQDYSFVWNWSDWYTPSSFTTDWGAISNFSYDWDWYFLLNDSSSENVVYLSCFDSSCYCWEEACSSSLINWISLPSWTYSVSSDNESSFTSISFDIVSQSSWGWSSDSVFPELSVPWSFTSWITELVENFGWTIANWLPVVILVALWITAIFALFRVVRWYAKSAFKW